MIAVLIIVVPAAVALTGGFYLGGWWAQHRHHMAAGHTEVAQLTAEIAQAAMSDRESAALRALACQIVSPASAQAAQAIADQLRAACPVPDAELARALIHARWITLDHHQRGRNCVQIARLLGLAAVELTQLDREVTSR